MSDFWSTWPDGMLTRCESCGEDRELRECPYCGEDLCCDCARNHHVECTRRRRRAMRMDGFRFWASHLIPVLVWKTLWRLDVPLGAWAPHALGRITGATNWKRADK